MKDDLHKICKDLFVMSPFYGMFLLGLNKQYSKEVSTAGVCRDGIGVKLLVNPEFWDQQDAPTKRSILLHEVMHICFKHIFHYDYFQNHELANIAADCECNSYIGSNKLDKGFVSLQQDPWCYAARFGYDNEKGTKWYYDQLIKDNNDGSQSPTNHTGWQTFADLSDAEKQLVGNQIDYQAKNAAEHVQKNAGNLPGELREYLEGLFKKEPPIYNWKKHFRRVVGNSITSDIELTKMRPSKRFPDARGIKLKRRPNIACVIDTSGSVSDEDASDFFSEIYHIWKTGVNITIIECDTEIREIFQYHGQSNVAFTGRGGTILEPAFTYYKQHKEFSSVVIFTDGYLYDGEIQPMRNAIWVITHDGDQQRQFPGIQINIPKRNKN